MKVVLFLLPLLTVKVKLLISGILTVVQMHVLKFKVLFAAVDVSSLQKKTILMYDQMAIALLRVAKSYRVTCTPSASGLKLKMVSIIIPEHKDE